MRLTASYFYTFFRPSKCAGRVYLRRKGEKEGEPSPYEEIMRRLGERHERLHLQTFPTYLDLASGTLSEREHRVDDGEKKALVHVLLTHKEH